MYFYMPTTLHFAGLGQSMQAELATGSGALITHFNEINRRSDEIIQWWGGLIEFGGIQGTLDPSRPHKGPFTPSIQRGTYYAKVEEEFLIKLEGEKISPFKVSEINPPIQQLQHYYKETSKCLECVRSLKYNFSTDIVLPYWMIIGGIREKTTNVWIQIFSSHSAMMLIIFHSGHCSKPFDYN